MTKAIAFAGTCVRDIDPPSIMKLYAYIKKNDHANKKSAFPTESI